MVVCSMLSCGLFSVGQNEVVEVFEQSGALVVFEQIVEQGGCLSEPVQPNRLSRAHHNSLALQSVSILDANKPSHDFQ